MKKLIVLMITMLMLSGCSHMAKQSEFWQHETVWASWDHARFSAYKYKCPVLEDHNLSQIEGWWGVEVPYRVYYKPAAYPLKDGW